MNRQWTLAFVGMGRVGQQVWRELPELEQGGLGRFRVTGVATRREGILHRPAGVDPAEWPAGGRSAVDAEAILTWLRTAPAEVLVELSALNPQDGQPAIDYIRAALTAGMHVVTANKGPAAFAGRELLALARQRQRGYRFESAVLDGLPVFRLPAAMPGCRLLALEGIVNSTTNLILTRMEAGDTFEAAVQEAQRLGIAEAEPAWDVEGWDAAMKLCVLANTLLDQQLHPGRIERQGIGGIGRGEIEAAGRRGRTIRLLARVSDGEAWVRPEEIPLDHLYATVRGTSNVLTFHFDRFGPLSLVEPSPGLRQTAYGIIADLLSVARGELWIDAPPGGECAGSRRGFAGEVPSV